MIQKVSEYIEGLMLCQEAVRRQFEISREELASQTGDPDPLRERDHEVVPGLINKYRNRVLCLLTAECAAYCRFCTRRRMVSDIEKGRVDYPDIDAWAHYLSNHPEVREVIISGGDPFTVSDDLFDYTLEKLSAVESVKVIRIGTRAPVSDPSLITARKLDAISKRSQPVYVGIHFEHPSEITPAVEQAVRDLRLSGAILYSQSVFLRGINDDFETLYELFSRLPEIGVRPYYIYRCDPVPGACHFIADFDRERRIVTRLRKSLSGLACPTYVIDAPNGSGKIPVPLDFWDAETSSYTDFEDETHITE